MRVCGLKLLRLRHLQLEQKVAPHAGVWIETKHPILLVCVLPSHPMRVWIETLVNQSRLTELQGRTPCGVWIETANEIHTVNNV
jgi:hypothetical protein